MKVNWTYVLGVTTIVGVIGLTAYSIKKSMDQAKTEKETISVEEAMALVADHRKTYPRQEEKLEIVVPIEEVVVDEPTTPFSVISVEETMELVAEHRKAQEIEDKFMTFNEGVEKPSFLYSDIRMDVPMSEVLTKEDKVLRHEPSSTEARNQFIYMELAEFHPSQDEYRIMLNLFQHDFNPVVNGDWDLKTSIIDYRVQFFGFGSVWAKEVTMADVILHYAKDAAFNLDEDVTFWVETFLQYNEFVTPQPDHQIHALLEELNNHRYFNPATESFGLFGLDKLAMNDASKIANQNIDSSVTYDIEFQEFLKQNM